MFCFTTLLSSFFALLLVSQSALAWRPLLESTRSPTLSLRQGADDLPSIDPSTIDPRCKSPCTQVLNAVNDLSNPQAVCTSTVMGSFQSCGDCEASVGADSVADIQSVVDEFVDFCSQNGLKVNGVTVSASSSTNSNGGERQAALGAVASVVAPLATLLLATW
ncbi:hypothetical protein GGX14DRAFT_654214 [Mycena pura]|uniref:Uncharacterized protein n=1 Tax=Mycena pura TaxID=153505 RepID=A0AAD6V4E2_9AGAR|nr:hypothetical protein GGX14DRAFT_654214 [Mycena pura]